MKNYFLVAMLVFSLMVSHTFCCAMAAESNADFTGAYEAYFDFLQDELEQIGKPLTELYSGLTSYVGAKPENYLNSEILYVTLLDLDNNGIPEMFYGKKVSRRDGSFVASGTVDFLYTYKNGQLVRLSEDTPVQHDWNYSNNTSVYTHKLEVTKDTAGRQFIHYVTRDRDDDYFYALNADGFNCALHMSCTFIPDFELTGAIHVESTTGKYIYSISSTGLWDDRKVVSGATYKETKERYTAGGVNTIILEKSIDTTIAEMKKYIPDYVENYYRAYNNPAAWAAPVVDEAIAAGVVPKELQTAYNRPITRAEFCALAVSYYEKVTNKSISKWTSFQDTDDQNVSKMAGLGVVTGVGNEKFDPYGTLTREQAATILARLSAALGNPIESATPTFADNTAVSVWAREAVGQMQATGIMGGVGGNRFDPQAPYTKEQSIITVKRMDSRLVPATGLTLVASESQLPIPVGSNAAAYITAGKGAKITPQFTPENTTNKTLTWTSSDDTVVSAGGIGIGAGTATLTATTENGVSANVVVAVRDNFVTDKLPLTVECIYKDYYGMAVIHAQDFVVDEALAADAQDAGSVQITSVETKTYSENILSTQKRYCDITITGKVSRIRDGIDTFDPYVKLILKDYDGNVLASKIRKAKGKKKGDEIELEFSRIEIPDQWGAYTIEFVSDEGKTAEDAVAQKPKIVVPDLPFALIGHTTVPSDSGSQKWKMIEVETMAIISIKVEMGDYDVKSGTYSANLICSGYCQYPYIEQTSAPDTVRWKILDSDGETVSSGSFYAPDLEYDKADNPQKVNFSGYKMNGWNIDKLKPGQTYTLVLTQK